jgi:hypothetical protein
MKTMIEFVRRKQGERKVRNDKKTRINPGFDNHEHDLIVRLAYAFSSPDTISKTETVRLYIPLRSDKTLKTKWPKSFIYQAFHVPTNQPKIHFLQ